MTAPPPPDPPREPEDTDPRAPKHDPDPGASILDAVSRRSGKSLKVHLRDAGSGDAAPVIDPKANTIQDELTQRDQGKYRILGEIARGGMGVVLRGHDLELGRDVAIKVVDGELSKRPEVVERFVEEAQIGGQLQHPGIVPVYEIGLMADERPYFTMKLIKGRTLAAMLTRRKNVEEDRGRFLATFESVCQTMAYAHSKGVIHRDLKPANIMIGAFGEVQVVDWGLSKVLHRGGVADEIAARDTALTVIETVRSGPGSGSGSMVGNVLGTPAYMSPEQAQGEIAKLDERTDVFALGAILCEVLTGTPPYVAAEGENVLRKAAMAELDEARARVESCSASEELKKLCLACLLPSRAARPGNAEEVAQTAREHLAGLEEAAHRAQLAAAEERLAAERSRRRQQGTVLVGVVLLALGGGWWWVDGKRRDRLAELSRGLEDVRAEVMQHERAGLFEKALESARGGLRLVEAGQPDGALRERAEALVATTEARWSEEQVREADRRRELEMLAFLEDVQMRQVDTGVMDTDAEIDEQYRDAFREFGIDLADPALDEVLARYRDTPVGIELALGFDGWARVVQRVRAGREGELELLTGIGLDLDPDGLRADVRQALVARDAGALLAIAEDASLAEAPPETMFLLGTALAELNQEEAALGVLTRGADLHPSYVALAYRAGMAHLEAEHSLRAEGYFRAALALRADLPNLHSKLSDALRNSGDVIAAIDAIEPALALAPDHRWNWFVLGRDLYLAGRFEEARQVFDRAGDALPNSWGVQNMHDAARVRSGELDFEDYVASVREVRGVGGDRWAVAGVMLAAVPPPGVELDPPRALALLEDAYSPDLSIALYWIALAAARVETGDGSGAVMALGRAEERIEREDRTEAAMVLVLAACAHRLEGEKTAASLLLERARRLRDELVIGRESEWSRSLFVRMFERFEPIAAGE